MKVANKLVGLAMLIGVVFLTENAVSLSYVDEVELNFTFRSTLTMSLSANSLEIDDLMPGTAGYSNTIEIEVLTNNVFGYTLGVTAGNSTTYNTTNLVHSTNGITPFSSLPTNSGTTLANFSDNKWGFAVGTIDSNTSYIGLPLHSGSAKKINITTDARGTSPGNNCLGISAPCLGGDTTTFTIGAKASSDKVAGNYTNVINFTVTANPNPGG